MSHPPKKENMEKRFVQAFGQVQEKEIIYFFPSWFGNKKEPRPDHQPSPRNHGLRIWRSDWTGLLSSLPRARQWAQQWWPWVVASVLLTEYYSFSHPPLHGRIIIPYSPFRVGGDIWLDLANELWAEVSPFASRSEHLIPGAKASKALFHMAQWSALVLMLASLGSLKNHDRQSFPRDLPQPHSDIVIVVSHCNFRVFCCCC